MGWKRHLFGALLPNLIISAGPDVVKPHSQRFHPVPGWKAPAGPSKKLATKYQENPLKMIDKWWSSRYYVSRYP